MMLMINFHHCAAELRIKTQSIHDTEVLNVHATVKPVLRKQGRAEQSHSRKKTCVCISLSLVYFKSSHHIKPSLGWSNT